MIIVLFCRSSSSHIVDIIVIKTERYSNRFINVKRSVTSHSDLNTVGRYITKWAKSQHFTGHFILLIRFHKMWLLYQRVAEKAAQHWREPIANAQSTYQVAAINATDANRSTATLSSRQAKLHLVVLLITTRQYVQYIRRNVEINWMSIRTMSIAYRQAFFSLLSRVLKIFQTDTISCAPGKPSTPECFAHFACKI